MTRIQSLHVRTVVSGSETKLDLTEIPLKKTRISKSLS